MHAARAIDRKFILPSTLLLLAACASPGAAYREVMAQQQLVERNCISDWESSQYEPVRGKLALSPYADELVRLQMNDEYPSAAEKPLVAKFASLLYTCRASMAQISSTVSPEVAARTIQQAQAELVELVNLHNRKITYGEFNTRRAQIAANRAVAEAYSDKVAWQNLIASERQRSSDFWQSFVRGREDALKELKANAPQITRCTPGLMDEIVCTTSRTGY